MENQTESTIDNTQIDEIKNRLGAKYIGNGVTITDLVSNKTFTITDVKKDGFVLTENVTIGTGQETNLFYKDFLDKFDKNKISVSGYGPTAEDSIILHQVIKDIQSGYTLADKENAIAEREKSISEKENTIGELVTEEAEFKSGGVVGTVKFTKSGIVREVRNQFGKLISEVQVGDKKYRRNISNKTYVSIDGNDLLRKEDADKIQVLRTGGSIYQEGAVVEATDTTEEKAKEIIENEVYADQTSLIEKLLLSNTINPDDIHNYYVYPKWEKTVVGDKLSFAGGSSEARDNFVENFDRLEEESEDALENEQISEVTHERNVEQINEAKDEFENLEAEPREISEWLLVSDSLQEKLSAQGEATINTEYGAWWGKTTEGSVLADGAIQKVVKGMNYDKYKSEKNDSGENDFKGFKNKETFMVKVYIDSSDAFTQYWKERAEEVANKSERSEMASKKENAITTLASELKAYYSENNPLSDNENIYAGLLKNELGEVDWKDIAADLLKDKMNYGGYMKHGGQIWLSVDNSEPVTYEEFYKINTAPDVENPGNDYFERVKNLKVGETIEGYHGADVKRVMKHGGITNQYEGKTPEQVWREWTYDQRLHFWNDHTDLIMDKLNAITQGKGLGEVENLLRSKYEELPSELKEIISEHVSDGQYEAGGYMKEGGKAGSPTISFQKHFGKDGTVYRQTIKIDNRTFDHLRDAVFSEIAMGKPQKDKYVQTSGYETYLTPLVLENGIVEMNNTQTKFINMFLKLPLKDRNTRLKVVDKYEEGGIVGRSFRYLELIPQANGLEIKLTPEGIEKVKEDGLTYQNASDYFDDIQGNSEYIYHSDMGESGFGMTSAEGITDGYYYDDGEYKTDYPKSAKVYWFPNYQIQFWGDILKDEGSAFFTEAKEAGGYMKEGGRVDITSNYYRFRQHSPKGVSECAVPEWAQKVAEATKSGAKITTCKKDGKWFVQSIMIPKDGVKASEARRMANEIKSKFSRKKKALGGVAETCSMEDIENTKKGVRALIETTTDEVERAKHQAVLNDLD